MKNKDMKDNDVVEGNRIIAEFAGDVYWQVWKKEEFGGYKPYWASQFKTKEECQKAMDGYFVNQMIGQTVSDIAQHKQKYEPKFITPEYHSDWNWLMGACKKFISMDAKQFNDGSMFGNPTKAFDGYYRDIQLSLYHIEIDQAFWNLTKAINWYNSTQKSKQ